MSSNVFWPWSGDVMQAWATMFRSMSQVDLINIVEQMNSKDADLETKIVTEGFSYGRQLGRINDALAVLVRHSQKPGVAMERGEQQSLDNFTQMAAEIAAIKVAALPLSDRDIDDLVRRMRLLKNDHRHLYEDVARQIDRLHARLKEIDIQAN